MKKTFLKIVKNPMNIFLSLGHRGYFNWIGDELFLRIAFLIRMGKILNLKNPRTFSEKLQWLKLFDHNPEYTQMVDKCEAKKYVSAIIGENYIIPTLGVWDNADEIEFEKLPNQFVIKCTHDSGGLILCKDKSTLNFDKAKKKLNKCLKNNYYWGNREWPYKNIRPRIIAEKYMSEGVDEDLKDYKFFCFNGDPKYCQVISDREKRMSIDFFDGMWNHLDFHEPRIFPFSEESIKCPANFDEMKRLAKVLSKDMPFIRVDFYEINGKVYFGELTFFPTSGMGGFKPEKWDYIFGSMIKLPLHS